MNRFLRRAGKAASVEAELAKAYDQIETLKADHAFLQARVTFLEKGITDIRDATENGKVCDDVAWFSDIETLFDHCGYLLEPETYYAKEKTP